MLCPKCGVSNPENNNFCQSCGASLTVLNPDPQLVPRQPLSTSPGAPAPPPPVSPSAPPSSPLTPPSQPVSPPVFPSASPLPSTPVEAANLEYAGFWKRLLAFFTDGLILSLIGGGMGFYVNVSVGSDSSAQSMSWLRSFLSFIIGAGYYIFFWVSQNGQTLGNKLLAIRVMREDGQPVNIGTAVTRYIGYLISAIPLGLGFLWVAWDSKKQGWHDKIANTVVVKTGGKSHTGIAILLLICYLIFIFFILVIMGLGLMFLAKEAKTNPDSAKKLKQKYGVDMSKPEMTQNQADKLADDVFIEINKSRQERGLVPIQLEYQLCAYAQRRLEQLSQLGRYDDQKGLYEDMANPEISRAYFLNYTNIGEGAAIDLAPAYQASKFVEQSLGSSSESVANFTVALDGCARANTKFLIFTTGTRR